MTQRLNKYLASQGFGSRRGIDLLIADGKVTVNGTIASMGQKVSPQDAITVNGVPVHGEKQEKIVVAFFKPRGLTSTRQDPHAKVTLLDYLPKKYHHLYPIGRLDRDSRGLLLLTNDGDLALKLSHPRYEHEKEYHVSLRSLRHKTEAQFFSDCKKLTREIVVEEAQSRPIVISESSFDVTSQRGKAIVTLKEGKKRQIRRLFSELGYHVSDLLRVRIGSTTLANLKEGEYAEIDFYATTKDSKADLSHRQ